jgi:hypothetical protein
VSAATVHLAEDYLAEAFASYEDAYRRIRARYGWNDEPVIYRGSKVWQICEPLPPRAMHSGTYGAYLAEVSYLGRWYQAAVEYGRQAALKRPPEDAARNYSLLLAEFRRDRAWAPDGNDDPDGDDTGIEEN